MEQSYNSVILKNLNEICVHFGVGRETVLNWLSLGAPIAAEGNGSRKRYSCEARSLQAWREKHTHSKDRGGKHG